MCSGRSHCRGQRDHASIGVARSPRDAVIATNEGAGSDVSKMIGYGSGTAIPIASVDPTTSRPRTVTTGRWASCVPAPFASLDPASRVPAPSRALPSLAGREPAPPLALPSLAAPDLLPPLSLPLLAAPDPVPLTRPSLTVSQAAAGASLLATPRT